MPPDPRVWSAFRALTFLPVHLQNLTPRPRIDPKRFTEDDQKVAKIV